MPAIAAGADRPPGELPGLSIVMPNYNHARFLDGAIAAHLGQSVPPQEILVVDDASTDESRAVVERIAARNPTVRLLAQPRNLGVNGATNVGLAEVRTPYVCISAADDLVGPNFTVRTLSLLKAYPQAAFCFSDPTELIEETGELRTFPLYLSDRPRYFSATEIAAIMRDSYFTFSSNTAVFRTDILREVGIHGELRWYSDWFADFVMAFRHGACYLPETLGQFRVTGANYSAGRRDADIQRELTFTALDLLESEAFRDVEPIFRSVGALPELSIRTLGWLAASPRHRRWLTPLVVRRLVGRGLWDGLRPLAPTGLRRALRRLSARRQG